MREYGWTKEYCMWKVSYAELFYWYDVIMYRTQKKYKIPKRINKNIDIKDIHKELDKYIGN